MDTSTAWKKLRIILSDRSDSLIIYNRSIEFPAFDKSMLRILSVDEMLLPKYVKWWENSFFYLLYWCSKYVV